MDINKVDMFIMTNQKYLPNTKLAFLRERLLTLDDSRFPLLTSVEMKDPTTLIIISIFLGTLGIDRFMIGDIGLGVLKLLTGGVCGIMTIVDWFLIMDLTREKNFNQLMTLL